MALREKTPFEGESADRPSVVVGSSHVSHLARLGKLGSRLTGSDGLDAVLDEALTAIIEISGARGASMQIDQGNGEKPCTRIAGECAAFGRPIELVGLDGEAVGTLTMHFGTIDALPREPRLVEGYARRLAEILERTRLSGDKQQMLARERHRAEQLRSLAAAAIEITTAESVHDVLRRVTEAAQAIIGTHQAVSSRLVHGWEDADTFISLSDKYAAYRSYDETPRGLGVLNAVTRENKPLRLTGAQLAAHPEFRHLADTSGHPPLPNYLAAPFIGHDDTNLGLIQMSDKVDATEFTREDEAILVQLAQTASIAIETIEAVERERAAREHAERVNSALAESLDQRHHFERVLAAQAAIFEDIAKGVPLGDVLMSIVQAIEDLTPDGRASILLLEDGKLRHGPAPRLPEFYSDAIDGLEIGPEVGSCGSAAWHARPVVVTDVMSDPKWEAFRDLAAQTGFAACWSTPILSGDHEVLGTLAVYYDDPRGPTPTEESVVAVFTRTAAVAIERSRDLADLVREKRIVQTLNDVSRAIGARLDVDEIVQRVTDAATDLTGAQFGAFFYNTIREDGEAYMLYTLSGAPRAAFSKFPMPRMTAIFEPTFRGEGTVMIDDVTADARYGKMAPYHGMPKGHLPVRSYLAVPVKATDGEVVGGLFFGHEEPGVFSSDARRVAEGIAAHAAIAIQNGRLYETARREGEAARRAFEERDHVARVLQSSLLPPSLPSIPGMQVSATFRPGAADVGGDFYDLFPVRGRDWGIVIGDVCGKGADAAALTALARHSLRTAAMLQRQPSTVLSILNEALLRSDTDGRFATAAFVRLTPSARGAKLVTASGGHPPIAVIRSWGDVMLIESPGSLLGVFPEPGTRDQMVELHPGDALVLYTDGVTEARSGDVLFGEKRLVDTLRQCRGKSAEEIVRHIEEAVTGFADGQSDDIAIVALTIEP